MRRVWKNNSFKRRLWEPNWQPNILAATKMVTWFQFWPPIWSPDTLGHLFSHLDQSGHQLGHQSTRSSIWSWYIHSPLVLSRKRIGPYIFLQTWPECMSGWNTAVHCPFQDLEWPFPRCDPWFCCFSMYVKVRLIALHSLSGALV